MPPTNALRVETRLTQVSVGYKSEGLIADEVCPILRVPKQAGKILEDDMSAMMPAPNGDDRIAMGELPGIIKTEIRDKTYSTHERAQGATVHDDEVDADNAEEAPYEVKVQKTELATGRLDLNRELRVKTLFATLSGASPGTKWDQDSSDPLADIIPAKFAVKDAIGVPPNSAIVPWEVFEHLRNNTALKSYFSGGATTAQLGLLSIEALKLIFGVENMHIPAAGMLPAGNQSAGFKSGTLSSVWGDDVYLFYRAPTPRRQMVSLAYTYAWDKAFHGAANNEKARVVTESYEERKRTLFIDARTYTEEMMLVSAAGYRLDNVLT